METKTIRLYSFFLLVSMFIFSSCKKENLPAKPAAGSFAINHSIPATVSKAQQQYELKIEGSTNGWWVTSTEGASWIVIPRKYGSSSHTQNITIQANTTGQPRDGWIKVSSTSGVVETISFKQEG